MYKQIGDVAILDDSFARIQKIEPAMYQMTTLEREGRPVLGIKPFPDTERLIEFDHKQSNYTTERIEVFSKSADAYKRMGIRHKVGIIWHGPAGTGKTSAAQVMMRGLVGKFNAVCVDATGYNMGAIAMFAKHFRSNQDNLLVIFCDECEEVLRSDDALSYLDGTSSVDGTVFLGCTNFIDKVQDRIKSRPSRVRYLVEVDKMPVAVISQFVAGKCAHWSADDVSKASYMASEAGMSLDDVKSAIVEVEIYGKTIEEAMKWKAPAGSNEAPLSPEKKPSPYSGFFDSQDPFKA